jgi:hypothetical protein
MSNKLHAPQGTPLPWVTVRDNETHFSVQSSSLNGNGDYVCDAWTQEDADFIVRAANSHEPLINCLRAYLGSHTNVSGGAYCECTLCNQARAVLIRAESVEVPL